MDGPYKVALVVDPDFGDRLRSLVDRTHAWVVDTPANKRAAEQYWSTLPQPPVYDIEKGITTFLHKADAQPEQWCADIIGSLDNHHNQYAHTPGYGALEVYGASPSKEVKEAFQEFGFTEFEATNFGFIARKDEP